MNTYEEFRKVISLERANLTRVSDLWNSLVKCDKTIPKEIQGRIRAAVGKTRLLLSEKFKQFEGLVEQSENNSGEKEITINDLQGFWDLVLIQVNEVKEMFRNLETSSEKSNSEIRKLGESKSRESEIQKEINREAKFGNVPRKKSSSDHFEQTERKIK